MTSSFSFAEFIPEPLTYKDDTLGGDGTVYAVQVQDLLSTEALVQFTRMEKQVRGLQLNDNDIEADTIGQIDQLTNQMMAILIPDLPVARLEVVPLQLKMHFVNWWRNAQGKAEGTETSGPNAA